MKLSLQRDHLAAGLKLALSAVQAKAQMPILSCVRLDAQNGFLRLTGTNLDLSIRCQVKADVARSGAIAVPAKRLAPIVNELPGSSVELSTEKGILLITSGSSRFRIQGVDAGEFPPVDEMRGDVHEFSLPQEKLRDLLSQVAFARSHDGTRYTLMGTFITSLNGKLRSVATDGRRLAVFDTSIPGEAPKKLSVILPTDTSNALTGLLRVGSTVNITAGESKVKFELSTENDSTFTASIEVFTKTIEGSYPNYVQVLPKESKMRVKFPRETLAAAVHRASLVCDDKTSAIRLSFANNNLKAAGKSPNLGESLEEVDCEWTGEPFETSFNPNFLLEPLRAVAQDEVVLELGKDGAQPAVIRGGADFLCVIMPVRL
jgi:DNA polymerase-3 subunit beta